MRHGLKRIALILVAAGAMLAGTTGAATAATITPSIPTSSPGPLHNAGSGLCLGIAGNHNAGQWGCTGHSDQTWHAGQTNADGYSQLINGNGQCLGVAGANIYDGAQLVGTTCLGTAHPDQYWAADPYGGPTATNS